MKSAKRQTAIESSDQPSAIGKEKRNSGSKPKTGLEVKKENTLPSTEFVKVEKSLTGLGFFTPSSKTLKSAEEKIISFTKIIDGNKVEARARIIPSTTYGLPVTADQDKYLALQTIIRTIHQRDGKVTNPITFTSAELIKLLGGVDSGSHFKEVGEWMMRMTTTTVSSEGVVYLAGRKQWATNAFHVFEQISLVGENLPDGAIADKNYVWLSEWQLENINHNHQVPVDFETYLQLKNHIAKVLVPVLQIWLYASRDAEVFEKRYDELCQFLNICPQKHSSRIKQQLAPSFDELVAYGYLSEWRLEKTAQGRDYKILFFHGGKFYADRTRRIIAKSQPKTRAHKQTPLPTTGEQADLRLMAELTKRGVTRRKAAEVITKTQNQDQVLDILEWGDHLIAKSNHTFRNPSGFYIYLVTEQVEPPTDFETSRQRQQREREAEARQAETVQIQALEDAYQNYLQTEIDRYLAETYTAEQYRALLLNKKHELLAAQPDLYGKWQDDAVDSSAESRIREEVLTQLSILTLDQFGQRHRHP